MTRESAYHAGERFVQEKAGEVESATMGIGAIHATIPAPAFGFLLERAFIVIAAADADGAIWCSQLGWEPGFMHAVDERTLGVDAFPSPDDPLAPILRKNCKVGTIAIDFATHRRMRLNGTSSPGETGIQITTDQVYANCPKYIAARSIESRGAFASRGNVLHSDRLGEEARAIITEADTFFVGSASGGGADASHRGGPAGFVEIVDNRTLRWPDYAGNSMFMTLGNITAFRAAGLLFIDWNTGAALQLTGKARVDWDPAAARRFVGAKRVVEFTIYQSLLTHQASPLRWSTAVPSRFYPREKNAAVDGFVDLELENIVPESDVISSFYLRRADRKPLQPWEPGMFLPIRLDVPGEAKPLLRNYTISNAASPHHYRLSIRRDPKGRVSKFMHDARTVGARIKAMTPRGKFVLDRSSDRPVVFISGGVGLTPMMAMSEELLREGRKTGRTRPMHFIHGTKNGRMHAFGDALREAATDNPELKLHFRYSEPSTDDVLGTTYDSVGYVDGELIRSLVDPSLSDFYLCGPGAFMQSTFDALVSMGVREDRIHFESFGSATVHKSSSRGAAPGDGVLLIPVRFSESSVEGQWTPGQTLLELAESYGLQPDFGCRSGTCGMCATRLEAGSIDYIEEPLVQCDDGEVLICCSVPHSSRNSKGVEAGITLAL